MQRGVEFKILERYLLDYIAHIANEQVCVCKWNLFLSSPERVFIPKFLSLHVAMGKA
jgi:hypothetical protein